jgi:hypothetical protein
VKSKLISIIFTAALLSLAESCFAQGFVNLDFESANIPNSTEPSSLILFSQGLPGWTGCFISSTATNQTLQTFYDGISMAGVDFAIVDTNVLYGFNPIRGNYSAFLFGGSGDGGIEYAAQISQSGLVPSGTKSIQFKAMTNYSLPFTVTLGGQAVDISPLEVFSNYTLYGGNIASSLAGQVATLSITESAPPYGMPGASIFELDDIVFSQSSIPEPSEFVLAALGGLLLGLRRRKSSSR